jgi:dUTPase
MSVVRIQIHSNMAKTPRANSDGSYNIYSAETCTIEPQQTKTIATDISLASPIGFYPMITSGELAVKFNIETSRFSSLSLQEYKFANGENQANRINLCLYNRSATSSYTVEIGDVVGILTFVRVRQFPIIEVDNINDPLEEKKNSIGPAIVKFIAKTPLTWFRRLFRNNPSDVSDKYFSNEIKDKIEELKQTELYLSAINQNYVLANAIWNLLDPATRDQIKDDFWSVRGEFTEKESEDKPKVRAPNPLNTDLEDEAPLDDEALFDDE